MKVRTNWFIPLGSLMGLGLGIVMGMLTHTSSSLILLKFIPYAELLAKIWIVLLLVMAVPLVAIYLFGSIMRLASARLSGKLVLYGLLVHILLLSACTVLSIGLSYLITFDLTPDLTGIKTFHLQPGDRTNILQCMIIGLGRIQTAVAQLIVPMMLFVVLLSIGVLKFCGIKQPIILFTKALSEKILSLLTIIFYALPFAVTCLTFVLVSNSGVSLAGIAGFYVLGVCGILVATILLQYGVVFAAGGTSVISFLRAILPVQLVAFSTCSSLACLPALLVSARKLGISTAASGVTVPFFVSFFRINLLVANPFSFFLLSTLYGLPVEIPNLLFFIGLMILTSFGSPGLPQMGNVYSLPVFLAAGIPVEGVLVLKALDAIPDVFKTILNVTEVGAVTSIISRWEKQVSLPSYVPDPSRVHSGTNL